jgi:hypothetical protein
MKDNLEQILKELDNSMGVLEMCLSNVDWYKKLPTSSGWYAIKTDIPISVLQRLGKPKSKDYHTDIPKTIEEIKDLMQYGLVIEQKNDELYMIYNGRAKNIRARAKEHFCGCDKTYCLCLKQYPAIWDYKWYFYYYPISNLGFKQKDSKMFRQIVEEGWRTKNGWPILCRQ